MACCSPHRRSFLSILAVAALVMLGTHLVTAEAQPPPLVRVRSSNSPSIAAVIQEAAVRSPLFRRLLKTIDATDGLVYVDEGICGHGVAACLSLSVLVSGPYRLVRILVDTHKLDNDCELMAAIGHELWHAIELLREPNVRNYQAAFSFFEREGPTDREKGRFETDAAVRTGLSVLREVCPRKRSTAITERD